MWRAFKEPKAIKVWWDLRDFRVSRASLELRDSKEPILECKDLKDLKVRELVRKEPKASKDSRVSREQIRARKGHKALLALKEIRASKDRTVLLRSRKMSRIKRSF